MMKVNKFLMGMGLLAATSFVSCTDLTENLNAEVTREVNEQFVETSALLDAAYNSMRTPYQDQSRFWAAQQHTSDETLGPTRGPDWDDNGVWRVLHDHTWDADHQFLTNTFNELLQIVFN
ncbi:MAG: RagB/SusD family nutrient uptake outer membrane protein, partial [Bacteroidota bacterium]